MWLDPPCRLAKPTPYFIAPESMSERKRGARETRSSSSSSAAGGAAASGGAAMSSAKKARQAAPAPAAAAESNGHPSAIIAPRCTYARGKGAEECPHIMVRGWHAGILPSCPPPGLLEIIQPCWIFACEPLRCSRRTGFFFSHRAPLFNLRLAWGWLLSFPRS